MNFLKFCFISFYYHIPTRQHHVSTSLFNSIKFAFVEEIVPVEARTIMATARKYFKIYLKLWYLNY